MNHHALSIFAYCQALFRHDWTFEYSDCHETWKRGRTELAELQEMQKKHDPDFVIWNKFAPSDYQKKVSTS